jgi:hypothetical protein
MKYHIKDRVLHIIYKQKEKTNKEFQNICEVSKLYEGTNVNTFIGFNFPISIVPKDNLLYKYINDVDYIIVYKSGDIQTRAHELRHAKYYCNKSYRDSVQIIWNSFTDTSKKSIIDMLLRMNYKNDINILLDEFQAYYFTENSNFFGKITFSS